MKQIIVVTNHQDKFEKEFAGTDIMITWSALSPEALLAVRGRSNILFVCLDHENHDDLVKIGLFLRDICIEDEKILYLYGNKSDVDEVSSYVPSLFIQKSLYSFADFVQIRDDLVRDRNESDTGKPVFLIIDDDTDYVEKLRVYLDNDFKVLVSRFEIREIASLIHSADIVLISMDGKLALHDFMGLFQMLAARKKKSSFKYYYMSASDAQRAELNSGSESTSISFSKEMDVDRVAKYFTAMIKR